MDANFSRSLAPASHHIVLLFLASFISYIIYQCFFHPLTSIPGPFLAKISQSWLIMHAINGDMNNVMIELHQRHGPLVRTGPNEISVSDKAAIRTIYAAGSRFGKSDWYSVWQGVRTWDLFAERNEKIHSEQRRLVSRAYSLDSLRDLESFVDEALEVFMSKMEGLQDSIVDMNKWSQLFAFDVIGGVTFSKIFGFMEAEKDDGAFKQIETALRSASWLGYVPSLFWINHALTPYIGNRLAVNARHGSLRTFAVNEITARKQRTDGNEKDILSKLFAISKEKPALDDNGVASMASSNIFAGSDTTAISIRAIIYYLLKNPDCKKRFMQEIDDRRKDGQLSNPVTFREAENMPYLQATIYEALRLHPAVGMAMSRLTPEGGAILAGKYIPAGTVVGANAWVVHRDPAIFGADADEFRPERWMQADTGDLHRSFLTFGAGSRVCIGRNISWLEISKLLPTLFMHYDLELCENEKEWSQVCWWFAIQRGLDIRLVRRSI